MRTNKVLLFLMFWFSFLAFSQEKKLPEGWDEILLDDKIAYMNLVSGEVSKVMPNSPARKAGSAKKEEFDPTITHKVKKGETLSTIARKYAIELAHLYRLNSLVNFDAIEEGQEIVIGYRKDGEGKSKRNTIPKSPVGDISSHRVAKGDTLYNIAKRYGVTVNSIKELNNIKDNRIFLGQNLKIK